MPRTKATKTATTRTAPAAKVKKTAVAAQRAPRAKRVAAGRTGTSLAAALKSTQSAKTLNPVSGASMGAAVLPQRSKWMTKLLILAWILVLAGVAYYLKGQLIVATVNNQPIFRWTLVRELEAQNGPQVLDTLILESMVRQEAASRKITVSDQEVNDELKKLEDRLAAQKQNLDQLLMAQGMTREILRQQITLQLMVDKMVDKNSIVVSDEEVKKYLDDNKAFLPKDVKPEELAPEVKTQLQQQKATLQTQEFFKSLQTKAKINHWLFPTTL